MSIAFIHGFILSAGLILPPGAQNVFLINQGANHKHFKQTLPAIITAGLCDTFLIILSVIGVSLIVLSLPVLQLAMYIIGFVFLTYMAVALWFTRPASTEAPKKLAPVKQIVYAVSVSLLNPHAILDTVGIIGTNSTAYTGDDLIVFAVSCIAVSWIFFILLVLLGRVLGNIDKNGKLINIINKLSSIVIFIVAVVILGNIVSIII